MLTKEKGTKQQHHQQSFIDLHTHLELLQEKSYIRYKFTMR